MIKWLINRWQIVMDSAGLKRSDLFVSACVLTSNDSEYLNGILCIHRVITIFDHDVLINLISESKKKI